MQTRRDLLSGLFPNVDVDPAVVGHYLCSCAHSLIVCDTRRAVESDIAATMSDWTPIWFELELGAARKLLFSRIVTGFIEEKYSNIPSGPESENCGDSICPKRHTHTGSEEAHRIIILVGKGLFAPRVAPAVYRFAGAVTLVEGVATTAEHSYSTTLQFPPCWCERL